MSLIPLKCFCKIDFSLYLDIAQNLLEVNAGFYSVIHFWPIPVAARSKAWACSLSLAGVAGSNPAWAWMNVSCECCVSSGRCLSVGPITRPEESFRVWCV